MALICEQSPFILSADDTSSASQLQLSLSPDPFDPSLFALFMAWPSAGQQPHSSSAPSTGGSTGSSRGGNNAATPLTPLSAYTTSGSSGGTPPSRLTPGSSNDSSALSYASNAHQAGPGPAQLDNATRPSAVAEFQLLHPSGRADDASPYQAPYGYRPHAQAQNIEEGSNVGLYHSHPSSSSFSSSSSSHNTPPTLRTTPAQSPQQAPYFSSPGALYPQSFESGPTGSYNPAAYGSLGGGSGPSAYSTASGQMTPAMQFAFPHGANGTPSGDSVDDPSPSPQSSGSDSPSLTAHSGSSSGLSRRRSGSRQGYHDASLAFMPPMAQIRKRPRRKAEEIERIYTCGFEECQKSYGTLNHLNAHVRNANHGEKRRPEEFRDIRNAWKRKKLEEAQVMQAAQAAEEQRQRGSGPGMAGPSGLRHPHRRPTNDDYPHPGFLAHRQHHAPGLGLPAMPQPLGPSRMPGMSPQGYGFPPSMPSAGMSPYSTRGPPAPWTPTDRPPMVSPNHPYMESQDPGQYFGHPIRVPQPPTGFNPAAAPRGPQGMPDYQPRQGSSGGYPPHPRDPSRQ